MDIDGQRSAAEDAQQAAGDGAGTSPLSCLHAFGVAPPPRPLVRVNDVEIQAHEHPILRASIEVFDNETFMIAAPALEESSKQLAGSRGKEIQHPGMKLASPSTPPAVSGVPNSL